MDEIDWISFSPGREMELGEGEAVAIRPPHQRRQGKGFIGSVLCRPGIFVIFLVEPPSVEWSSTFF